MPWRDSNLSHPYPQNLMLTKQLASRCSIVALAGDLRGQRDCVAVDRTAIPGYMSEGKSTHFLSNQGYHTRQHCYIMYDVNDVPSSDVQFDTRSLSLCISWMRSDFRATRSAAAGGSISDKENLRLNLHPSLAPRPLPLVSHAITTEHSHISIMCFEGIFCICD